MINLKYYISDNHFGDERVMRLANRPFSSVEEMNETMIYLWNQRVGADDEIYIVGDFALDERTAIKILPRLNGQKYLLKGNHDSGLSNRALKYFQSVNDIKTIRDNDISVTLCHYPLLSYENSVYNGYHVFGHIHNNPMDIATSIIPHLSRHLHCGADVIGFEPRTLDELIKIKEKNYLR